MIHGQQIACSLLTFLLLLTACGGGGKDTDTQHDTSAPGNLNGVNGNFKGKLFVGHNLYGPWIMDFSTGRYTPVPGMLWEDNPDYFHRADFSAYPAAYDGSEFIETIEECRHLGGFDYIDCVNILDSQGGVVSQFEVPHETQGAAKLSRDRQYFAVRIEAPFADPDPKQLTLFTRNGRLLDASDEDVRSFDWLPDNRLIYASDQTIYMTQPGSAKGSEILTLPDNAGTPTQFAVSPDGSQLAFTLMTDVSLATRYGTTWILNLDGSNLRQLTNSPGPNDPDTTSDDPKISFPTWSPDGRWIAVVEGVVRCNSTTGCGPEAHAYLYVVPSDGDNVMLTEDDTATSAVVIYSHFDEILGVGVGKPELLRSRFVLHRGTLAWLP